MSTCTYGIQESVVFVLACAAALMCCCACEKSVIIKLACVLHTL